MALESIVFQLPSVVLELLLGHLIEFFDTLGFFQKLRER